MNSKLQDIKNKMNDATTIKELEALQKDENQALLEAKAYDNKLRKESEELAKQKFEAERLANLAKQERIETLKRQIVNSEDVIAEIAIQLVTAIKQRSETYCDLRKLTLEVNRDSQRFGFEELVIEDLFAFYGNSTLPKDIGHALIDQVVNLISQHDKRPELEINPENVKINSLNWGKVTGPKIFTSDFDDVKGE